MNHLLRGHAPITDEGWAEIDAEAKERLLPALGARKLIDFSGPLGWQYSASNLGEVEAQVNDEIDGVFLSRRRVLPLVEVRTPFSLKRSELARLDRGAADTDLSQLDQAARRTALAENTAVFHGLDTAGMGGIAEVSSHDAIPMVGNDPVKYPQYIAKAIEMLLTAGIEGPYGVALSPECYTNLVESSEEGGYPQLSHIRKILDDGPLVWAPGLKGAVVASLRGGDFLFESGQDLSVGYDSHDAGQVNLYLEESFSFRVATPEAAVALTVI